MDAEAGGESSSEHGSSPKTQRSLVGHLSNLVIKTSSGISHGDDSQPSTFRRSQRLEPFFIGVAGEYLAIVQKTDPTSCMWSFLSLISIIMMNLNTIQ
jgi:hypothetical protein